MTLDCLLLLFERAKSFSSELLLYSLCCFYKFVMQILPKMEDLKKQVDFIFCPIESKNKIQLNNAEEATCTKLAAAS